MDTRFIKNMLCFFSVDDSIAETALNCVSKLANLKQASVFWRLVVSHLLEVGGGRVLCSQLVYSFAIIRPQICASGARQR